MGSSPFAMAVFECQAKRPARKRVFRISGVPDLEIGDCLENPWDCLLIAHLGQASPDWSTSRRRVDLILM